MWRRIAALILKEFKMLWKDRKSRMVLVVPPLVQLVLFGSAATFEVSDAALGLWIEDRARPAQELVSRFEASPAFHVVARFDNPRAVQNALDSQKVKAVLHVGQTFSADVAAGRPARVQLLLDEVTPGAAGFESAERSMFAEVAAAPHISRAAASRPHN